MQIRAKGVLMRLSLLTSLALCSLAWLASVNRPAEAETTNCTAITALPAVIDASGVWCLTSNLAFSRATHAAINISRPDVTIDMNGHFISGLSAGPDTQAVGIYANNPRGVTIRNGTIRGFGTGIRFVGTLSATNLVENVRLDQNRIIGIKLEGGTTTLRNNEIVNTGGATLEGSNAVAVSVGQATDLTIVDNQITHTFGNSFGTGYSISISSSSGVEIRGNTVKDTGYGILIDGSNDVLIDHNRVFFSGFGIVASNSTTVTCTNNVLNNSNSNVTGCSFGGGNLTPF